MLFSSVLVLSVLSMVNTFLKLLSLGCMVATSYISYSMILVWSFCVTKLRSLCGRAAWNSCILKKCIILLTASSLYVSAVASRYPLLCCGAMTLFWYVLMITIVSVIRFSKLRVSSLGFMARLESPLMISLSFDCTMNSF
jgi:hypothetical protein